MNTDDEVKRITLEYTSGQITHPEYRQALIDLYRRQENYSPSQRECVVTLRPEGKPAAMARLKRGHDMGR